MTKVSKLVKTAPGDIGFAVALAEIDQIDISAPVIDIKLLKKAILHIETEDPDAKSIRIGAADYYIDGMKFLVLTTQAQELDTGEKKLSHIISPLTVHVDKADKYSDTDPQVFIEQTTQRSAHQHNGSMSDLYRFDNLEDYDDDVPDKKRIVVKLDPMTGDKVEIQDPAAVGYQKPKKRGRPPKNP